MLSWHKQTQLQGESELSRRQLLRVGALSMMGLSLAEFLQAKTAATSRRAGPAEKSCIFIVQGGGPSQLDTWDMKPSAPVEYRGPYKPIATRVPGLHICELMPRLAQLADRYCLLRSLTHGHC